MGKGLVESTRVVFKQTGRRLISTKLGFEVYLYVCVFILMTIFVTEKIIIKIRSILCV